MSTIDKQGERVCNIDRHRVTNDFASTVCLYDEWPLYIFVIPYSLNLAVLKQNDMSFFDSIGSLLSTQLLLV